MQITEDNLCGNRSLTTKESRDIGRGWSATNRGPTNRGGI
jgi:hypothetical protein